MSEDIIVIAIDDKIAWHNNEIEYLQKIKAEHIARTGAKIRKPPGPPKGFRRAVQSAEIVEVTPTETEAVGVTK